MKKRIGSIAFAASFATVFALSVSSVGQTGGFVPDFRPIESIKIQRIEPIRLEPVRVVVPPPPLPEIERQEIPDPPKCHFEELKDIFGNSHFEEKCE